MPFVGENCRMQYGNNSNVCNLQQRRSPTYKYHRFFSYTKNWSVEKLLRVIIIYLERSFARYTHQLLVHFEYLQP